MTLFSTSKQLTCDIVFQVLLCEPLNKSVPSPDWIFEWESEGELFRVKKSMDRYNI